MYLVFFAMGFLFVSLVHSLVSRDDEDITINLAAFLTVIAILGAVLELRK